MKPVFEAPPPFIKAQCRRALEAVVTPAEATQRWNISRGAIDNAISKGYLVARQSGATWLIAVESLVRLYGEPQGEETWSVKS